MGPLAGIKIIELAGIGPGPMTAMMLGDMGADVVRVDRTKATAMDRLAEPRYAVHNRSRRSVAVDLQAPAGVEVVKRLAARADGLVEPFRPGVAERLGVGPDACLAVNPRLVYGRMTGWGQDGPLAKAAGHDINYIALTGLLHAIGRGGERPVPPLNLVGDYGGGGMLLAFGMVCGLLEAQRSGKGQVVDAAMVDGSALLFGAIFGMHAAGRWTDERGENLLDTGAPFYDVYECRDGSYISIGSIERQFYAELMRLTGLEDDPAFAKQMDRASWPELKVRIAELFKTKTRDEWCELMEMTDVCFAPVLSLSEAAVHPHNVARQTFVDINGVTQPAPAPRFSRTVPTFGVAPAFPGQHTREILEDWGVVKDRIDELVESGAVVDT